MDPSEERTLRQRLHQLRREHRELDDHIARLTAERVGNQLELSRMKRRKLQLKDDIARLESLLIPNLNA
ncbi:MAG: YdcH family protein [Pseudomonadota bacterium]